MRIDIHRHAEDQGTADLVMRNLFHYQEDQISKGGCYSAGLHPWHVNSTSLQNDLQQVRNMVSRDEVLAIGEAGLDKSIKTPLDVQHDAFLAQVKIAMDFKKPMIIHCVRAYNEIFSIRKEQKDPQPWIIHWFNASSDMGKQLIDKGFYLSFGHMLFNEKSKAFKAFTRIPADYIFLETDDSAYRIDEVYEQAAKLREISVKNMERIIDDNFTRCFGKKI